MTGSAPSPASAIEDLAALRGEIDAIDRALHEQLIARGAIIDRLIAVKARQGGTSAFRPDREASMMRRLLSRHRGILPLDTVEGIWRIIISTFTYVQAPYTVHADIGLEAARTRDSCRFHFGFTVPLQTHEGTAAVIDTVAAARGDLGLVHATPCGQPWWTALEPADAPKIIARLPFVGRADHAAGLPLFVVAKPLTDVARQECCLYAVHYESTDVPASFEGVEIIDRHIDGAGSRLLVAESGGLPIDAMLKLLGRSNLLPAKISYVGSHAARFDLDVDPPASQ